ncbi:MAG: bifunctional diguanylate cyclase/phosphodiesterase [Aquificota bacterium]|nr:bifunctional diguanylate cyclase/phosphodiesterase [Aquificota bacterium]
MKHTIYRNVTVFILAVAFTVAVVSTAVVVSAVVNISTGGQGGPALVKLLAFVFLTPILGALTVTYILRRKIALAIKLIREEMNRVRSLEDLSDMSFKKVDFGFEELNEIRTGLVELVERLNRVAVDRKTFELELRLLQKLIITSEVVRDWRKVARAVLKNLNNVIRFSYTFLVFSEGGKNTVYVFWNTKRDRRVEDLIKDRLGEVGEFNHLELTHAGVNAPVSAGSLRLRKLRRPSIGGALACGMEVLTPLHGEEVRVIDNFLLVLLQVIGSLKAVDEFTGKLEYYATRDPLTGLYNQRVFWEMLSYEVERAKRRGYKFSLLVVDIDNFKLINDTYGHEFGDEVLRRVADTLRDSVRKEDIVARYGGDEFAVILPYSSGEQAVHIADRIVESIGNLKFSSPDGKTIKVSVSVGVAVFPDHAQEVKHLFLIADNMMYRAKEEGKSKVLLPKETDIEETSRKLGEKGLMIIEAVENRNVFPVFQPIVDLRTSELHAYEVLMRLETEDRILSAGEFIPLAESMGLVHKLDYILMEKALKEVADSGFNGKVFFNLSPRALILEDFIENILSIVKNSGVDPGRIVFELTERDTVKNLELLKVFVNRLKDQGFSFAIDDFGAGFASFMYLKHFPVDYIKIEGEFIRSLVSSSVDRAFVLSITTMCNHLNIKTVAEFVEDETILKAVKDIGIDYAQGFYVGKPVQKPEKYG